MQNISYVKIQLVRVSCVACVWSFLSISSQITSQILSNRQGHFLMHKFRLFDLICFQRSNLNELLRVNASL